MAIYPHMTFREHMEERSALWWGATLPKLAEIGRNWDLVVEGRWPLKQIQWVGVPGGCCARPTWLALRWEDHAGNSLCKRHSALEQRSRTFRPPWPVRALGFSHTAPWQVLPSAGNTRAL